MQLSCFLILLLIKDINNISPLIIYVKKQCLYPIPFLYQSLIYFLCDGRILNYNTENVVNSVGIHHYNETGIPIVNNGYIITINNSSSLFNFSKKQFDGGASLGQINSGYKLKEKGNVCFIQFTAFSINYYFCAYIDSDLFLHIVQFNFDTFQILFELKSNILIKGPTIDCKGFSTFNHIICVYVGYDGCNVNIYSVNINQEYSNALIQKNTLVDIGFNCDSKSVGQKIYNIDDDQFFVCYSQTDNNIYCILGKHELSNSLKIISETNKRILENCEPYYSGFDIGKIGVNYLLVCTKDNKIKYKAFSKDLQFIGSDQYEFYDTNYLETQIPFVLYQTGNTLISFYNKHYECQSWSMGSCLSNDYIYMTGYFNLSPIECSSNYDTTTYEINEDIIINLSGKGGQGEKIRIFELPPKGTFTYKISTSSPNYILNTEFYTLSDTIFYFNFPIGGEYTYSYISYDTDYYLLSGVCSGSIKIRECYQSCKKCSENGNSLTHRCNNCLTGYFPLEERVSDTTKNCYNSTTILELNNGYYLASLSSTDSTQVWKECFNTCKKCSSFGDSSNHLCLSCKNGYILDSYIENNCVVSCDKFWHRDTNKINHICINECNEDYPYLVLETNECVNSCISANNFGKNYYFYDGKCISECPENTLPDALSGGCHELNNFDNFYKGIVNYIISVNHPSNIYIYNENINFVLYNSTESGIKEYKNLIDKYNITYLNLDECLNQIRSSNFIYENYVFYIALFEFKRNDVMTPQYNFILYNQYGVKYKNEMCNNISITKSFKNSTLMDYVFEKYKNDHIDILYYSKSNKFYNDICVKCSNDSYDILLEDRYELFHNNSNYYFCEENCNITNIDLENYKVDCICSNLSSFNEYSKTTYKRYKEDKIIEDKNFQFMKCHISPFTIQFLKQNYGNYIILTTFISQIISCISFSLGGLNKIILSLTNILGNPPNKYSKKRNKDLLKRNNHLRDSNKLSNYNFGKTEEETNNPNEDEIKNNNYYIYKVGQSIENFYNSLKKKYKNEKINEEIQNTDNVLNEKNDEFSGVTYSNLYCFTIKNKHKLICLCYNNEYDIFVYKLSLFILTFSLDVFFCCLFDFSSHIKKLYQKKKYFIGKDEILIGIFSLIPSYFITKIIDCFMEYKSEIEQYENNEKKEIFINKFKSKMKCKFIIYFILTFIINGFTWYFVSVFFETYKNKNTLINLSLCYACNFFISFIIPFIYYGFVNYLEYKSISKENQCLYNFAMFLLKL